MSRNDPYDQNLPTLRQVAAWLRARRSELLRATDSARRVRDVEAFAARPEGEPAPEVLLRMAERGPVERARRGTHVDYVAFDEASDVTPEQWARLLGPLPAVERMSPEWLEQLGRHERVVVYVDAGEGEEPLIVRGGPSRE